MTLQVSLHELYRPGRHIHLLSIPGRNEKLTAIIVATETLLRHIKIKLCRVQAMLHVYELAYILVHKYRYLLVKD
jgi:hypothetical protein